MGYKPFAKGGHVKESNGLVDLRHRTHGGNNMPIPNVNQITTTLRGMPDQQLQQYAAMHKNDPYILSLAIQESNSRQQLRASAMAKMAGQQPPTVADQDLAKMTQPVQPPAPQGMPQQGMPPRGAPIPQAPQAGGVAALPAQNMQGMAEGGIAGYAGGGAGRGEGSAIDAYRQYAVAKARQLGLSPYLADSIFRIESGYNPNARSKTGPVGIGQLTKATGQAYGVDPDERTDPYKNIDASVAYMADLQKKYGGDSAKMAVAYRPRRACARPTPAPEQRAD
jgi:soluble lytic murein transglycosylase-like protein